MTSVKLKKSIPRDRIVSDEESYFNGLYLLVDTSVELRGQITP